MAIVVKDRVKETSTVTGQGTVTLLGASPGYVSFETVGDTNTTYYTIFNPEDGSWEVGYGTVSLTTGTWYLSRDAVLSNSLGTTAKVDFAAGVKDVFCTYPAEKAIYEEEAGDTIINGGPITIWGTGISATPNAFGSTVGQMFANVNNFSQLYNQNLSGDQYASSDFVAYNDLTTDGEEFYVDMGINSSGFDDTTTYPIFPYSSAYLYSAGVDGGTRGQNADLYIGTGTSNSDIVLFAGGLDKPNISAVLKCDTQALVLKDGATALSTDSGEKLQVYGTAKITGAATFGSTVTLNANPSTNLEAATKQYVDAQASTAFVVHPSVRLATAVALPSNVYNNGTGGVGATLTGVSVGQLAIDGVNVAVGDRVLIKNEASQAYNGAYTVTVDGSAAAYVLTRATDFDTTGSGEIANNAYFYVTAGSTNIGSSWILAQTAAITVGTTALPFSLFAQPIGYTVNSPLSLVGTTLSLSGVVDAVNGGTGYGSYTVGQMLYADTTTTLAKVGIGSQYQSLTSTGSAPSWGPVQLAQPAAVSGALGATNGGTGQSTYATGDMLYSSASNTLSKLSGNTSTTKQFLTQTGTGSASQAPAWGTISGSDVTSAVSSATNVAGGLANQLHYQTGPGATSFVTAPVSSGTALTWNGSSFAWSTVGATITNDTTTNTDYYPVWANASSGSLTTAYVSSTKLKFNPSTGALTTAGTVTANGTVLTGNTGTVTSVATGTGLSGGTITTTGTISLANTAVAAGSYTNANITVDAQGRITAASNGSSGGMVDGGTYGTLYLNNWFRSNNATGWYNQTYGGGIFMQDTTYVRTYGSKQFYCDSTITAGGNVVANSDETLKTNWRDLPTDFVEQLAKVKHGTYDRIDVELTQDGVSAQSLQTLLPHSVMKGADEKLTVAYGNAAMVSAVQLAQRVVEQDKRIAALEELVAKLTQGGSK